MGAPWTADVNTADALLAVGTPRRSSTIHRHHAGRPARATPQQAAYQCMLTGDPVEAIEQARAFLKDGTVLAYYDEILVGALRLAQADAERGRLDDARLENIFKTVSDTVEDLAEHRNAKLRTKSRRRTHQPPTTSYRYRGAILGSRSFASRAWAGWTIVQCSWLRTP